jgi:hypothetical protein
MAQLQLMVSRALESHDTAEPSRESTGSPKGLAEMTVLPADGIGTSGACLNHRFTAGDSSVRGSRRRLGSTVISAGRRSGLPKRPLRGNRQLSPGDTTAEMSAQTRLVCRNDRRGHHRFTFSASEKVGAMRLRAQARM